MPSLLGSFSTGIRHEALRALDLGVVEPTAHEALDRIDGVAGIGDGLALGELADEALTGLGERDDRRDRPAALGGRDDGRLAALHDGHDGVRGAEVDADDLAHGCGGSLSVRGCGGIDVVGGGGCGDGHEGRAQDAVAQPIAAPGGLDDLALGPAGAGDGGDRFVFARVESRARRCVDGRDALALEQDAQLAIDGGDTLEPRVVGDRFGPGVDGAVEVVREVQDLADEVLGGEPEVASRSSAVRRL